MRQATGLRWGGPLRLPSCLELVQNSTCHLVHLIRKEKQNPVNLLLGQRKAMGQGKPAWHAKQRCKRHREFRDKKCGKEKEKGEGKMDKSLPPSP